MTAKNKSNIAAVDSSKELYYKHFAPSVPMEDYFQYEDRFSPTNGLVGYDEFYNLCLAYEAEKNIPFDEFRKNYEYYQQNDKKSLSYHDFFKYQKLYEETGSKEEYSSFQASVGTYFAEINTSYQKYSDINEKLRFAMFLPVYGLLKDTAVSENYTELLTDGYLPEAKKLMLSYKLSILNTQGYTCAEIFKCLEASEMDGPMFEQCYYSYFAARKSGSLEDLSKECRYYNRSRQPDKTDNDGAEVGKKFSKYYRYYHLYRDFGGKDGIVKFGSNLIQCCLAKGDKEDMMNLDEGLYELILKEYQKEPEKEKAFPFCEL